jgi:hypothetical protein
MASSQSIIHKPEAPTAAFDLGIFSKVLMYKQAKFDAGADAIQSKINQLESQSVIGDAQKQYLSQKVNGIIEGVNGMGGMDFSDRNVINQTSSYIDSITKDPIITNAINNTRQIQKGVSYWEKLKADAASGKKGVYYNPANEYDYMEGVNDYVRKSKTDASASYSDRPISPPVDVNKQLMTAAKDVVASTYVDRDGNNRYILKTGKVVTADRLYEHALTQIQTDPNLANQIRINAKYNYLQKGPDGNLSENQLENLRATYVRADQNKVARLELEKAETEKLMSLSGDKNEQIRFQAHLDETNRELDKYRGDKYNRLREIDAIIATNPEQAATTVYSNRLLEGIAAARAFKEENVKFDTAAMFEDKMRFDQDEKKYQRSVTERKLIMEQTDLDLKEQKMLLDAQGDANKLAAASGIAGGTGSAAGGIISEVTSLPTNVRKSSQETQMDQIKAIDMQKANVQQDYYHYLYNFKGATDMFTKEGKTYVPTEKGKNILPDQLKILKDLRDGKKIPAALDPEFIKIANKMQELDLVRSQYVNNIIDVNKEALNSKRKELGLNDTDYDLFLRGKSAIDQLPEIETTSVYTGGQSMSSTSPGIIKAKDYSKLSSDPQTQKAVEMYKKYQGKLIVDKDKVESIYVSKGTQILPRSYIPVGLKESDLKARGNALKEQIRGRGYFSMDGKEKPEQTRGADYASENIKYIGDFYGDLGNGARPYVQAEIDNGLSGKDKVVQTVLVDVDDTYAGNFRSFAQNANEAARQEVLRNDRLDYDSMSSDGRNVIKTTIVKQGRGVDGGDAAALQVYITHDSKGQKITPKAITLNKTAGMSISKAVELAKTFADDYAAFYRKEKAQGRRTTVSIFLDELNKPN